MFKNPFYHQITKKTIVAFGQLFSGIRIQRFNTESVMEQLIDVPISYGNREKWYQRLTEEKEFDKRVAISLPRIGFEIVGIKYDASRRLNKLTQYRACTPTAAGNFFSAFAPVPYTLTFSLYVMTKTQDDMFQIIEQIIPYFGPQYNLTINAIPQLDIALDVPVTLENVQIDDSYEGAMEKRREVIGTLTFSVKIEYLGPLNDDADTIITAVKSKIDPQYGEVAREVDVSVAPGGTIDNYTTIEDHFDIPRPIA
jgi:T4-like virus Myoviridae tail sheath stabiliser